MNTKDITTKLTRENIIKVIAIIAGLALVIAFPSIVFGTIIALVIIVLMIMFIIQIVHDTKMLYKDCGMKDDVKRWVHRMKVRFVWTIRKMYLSERRYL